jgi:hypothetical protein
MKQQIVNDPWLRRQYDKLKKADEKRNANRVQHYIDKIADKGYRVGRTPAGEFQLFMQARLAQPAPEVPRNSRIVSPAGGPAASPMRHGSFSSSLNAGYYGSESSLPLTPGHYQTQVVRPQQQLVDQHGNIIDPNSALGRAISESIFQANSRENSVTSSVGVGPYRGPGYNGPNSFSSVTLPLRGSIESGEPPRATSEPPNDSHIRLAIQESLKSIKEVDEQKRRKSEQPRRKRRDKSRKKERHSAPSHRPRSKSRRKSRSPAGKSKSSKLYPRNSLKPTQERSKSKSRSVKSDSRRSSMRSDNSARSSLSRKSTAVLQDTISASNDELDDDDDDSTLCVICTIEKRTHMIYPCGHKVFCKDCVASCGDDLKECPLCRKKIKDIIKVFD